MKVISCFETQQDTVKNKTIVLKDSATLNTDSVSDNKIRLITDSVPHRLLKASKPVPIEYSDTTSVCSRNIIADVTFYDSANVVKKIESSTPDRFPFLFTEKTRQMQAEAKASLVKHLRTGQDLPFKPLHDDWIIGIILISALLYTLVRTTSKSIVPEVYRFFLFKGIRESASRDLGGLFQRQSSIPNLISFFTIGLFAYCGASLNNLIPAGISGVLFWLICVGVVITAVFLRHGVCLITGYMSGEKDAFRHYLLGIYQSYRFSALFLFILVILMSYTIILPARECFSAGIIVLGILYLIRVLRLVIIFLNRNISIFYLILYLCALEFLPVVISVKYFTGLV